MSLFIFAAFLSLTSVAQASGDCHEVEGTIPYQYCIHKAPGSTNEDVLYYLHGGGGNEHQWENSASRVREEWKKNGHSIPVVITVSFGPVWFLVEKNSLATSHLLDFFHHEVMPAVEQKALGRPASRRLLAGASMGGFNSFQLLLNLPPTTFSKVALLCGAFINLSPWATDAEIVAHAKRLGVPVRDLRDFRDIVKAFVPDEATWFGHVSPIELARTRFRGSSAQILVAGNQGDAHFFEGSRLLAAAFAAGGARVEEKVWPGKHCAWNPAELASFLR